MTFVWILPSWPGRVCRVGGSGWTGPTGHSRGVPGLVNIEKAIDNGHKNSEFSHEKWWIFP